MMRIVATEVVRSASLSDVTLSSLSRHGLVVNITRHTTTHDSLEYIN